LEKWSGTLCLERKKSDDAQGQQILEVLPVGIGLGLYPLSVFKHRAT
jgi:hypothetical protein